MNDEAVDIYDNDVVFYPNKILIEAKSVQIFICLYDSMLLAKFSNEVTSCHIL